MALFRVQPTWADVAISDTVSRYTDPAFEFTGYGRSADRAGRCEHQ
ncbi:MAG: hypothetical protein HY852_24155 [Bradyrhizobium sp.]|nr:hypothetical protein [Bradyrhizobium sp.]MBI5264900.1 hypothetical protein [Bradyrhizobium sp.]